MDLLIGATGILGFEVARRLQTAGRSFKALVRTSSRPETRRALEELGVQTVVGDLKDPASLRAACAGVTNVISTASSTLSRSTGDDIESVDRHGHLSLVAAAKEAGVKHFVYVSFPAMNWATSLQDAKRAVESELRKSGLSYTILQPSYFYEVWCSPALGFDPANAKARVFGAGEGPINWISMYDVADAAVASLDNPRAVNQTFLMGGPEALTQNEIIRRCEKRIGRSIEREVIPLAVLADQYRTATDPLAKVFAALSHLCGEGNWVFDSTPMREALGITPRTIDGYLEQICPPSASTAAT